MVSVRSQKNAAYSPVCENGCALGGGSHRRCVMVAFEKSENDDNYKFFIMPMMHGVKVD